MDASHFTGVVVAAFYQKTPQTFDFSVTDAAGAVTAYTTGFYKSSDCYDMPIYTYSAPN